MTVEALAVAVIDACEAAGIAHMLTGAFATSFYGVPRSTQDVDVVVSVDDGNPTPKLINELKGVVAFDPQVRFDTLTWGRRQVGTTSTDPPFQVEVFELFDDDFVQEQFARRQQFFDPRLQRTIWLPTPEDLVVQKIRWGRPKDLDDARDVLVVQRIDSLDLERIQMWCDRHDRGAVLNHIVAEATRFAGEL